MLPTGARGQILGPPVNQLPSSGGEETSVEMLLKETSTSLQLAH